MNVKKFAVFIIVAGILASAFAGFKFVSISTDLHKRISGWDDLEKRSQELSSKYGLRTTSKEASKHARALSGQIEVLKENARKARKQPTLILVIGLGILFLGTGLYFSSNKGSKAPDTPQK